MSTVLIWLAVAAMFGLIAVVIFWCTSGSTGYPPVESHTQLTEDIVKTMNQQRAERGFPPITFDATEGK